MIAVPGKLTLMSDDLTNVTVKRELYEVERDGNTIEYDGMTMERVDRPTAECAAALDKAPLPTPLPYRNLRLAAGDEFKSPLR